jgi:hypothetical protein
MNANKFVAQTNREIRCAALMLAGADPRRQAKWVRTRSAELRSAWRGKFEMTPDEVERLVNGVMLRLVERIGQLEVRGVGMA